MLRTNGEIIRDLRKKEALTMEELGKKLGVRSSFVNDIEKGRKPIPENLLEKIIRLLNPTIKDMREMKKNIIEKEVPNVLMDIELKEEKKKEVTLPVYVFDTRGNGIIDLDVFVEEEFIVSTTIKISKDSKVIKIVGENMEPMFFDSDKVLLSPCTILISYDDWKGYNNRIVVASYKGLNYFREVIFRKGVMYLYSFNEDLYPEIEIKPEDEIFCKGVITKLIERDMEKIRYKRL